MRLPRRCRSSQRQQLLLRLCERTAKQSPVSCAKYGCSLKHKGVCYGPQTRCLPYYKQTKWHPLYWRHQRSTRPHLAAQNKIMKGFSYKYNLTILVYFELFEGMYEAISREKQIKAGSRKAKINLIESINRDWKDLYPDICS